MRLLVCGSRDWADGDYVYAWLDRLARSNAIKLIIHGAARGADAFANYWAQSRSVDVDLWPAQWRSYPPNEKWRAGHDRNQQMLDKAKPDLVVAFKNNFNWKLDRGGTEDMVRRAMLAGVPTLVLP